jgi:hypothetical protein
LLSGSRNLLLGLACNFGISVRNWGFVHLMCVPEAPRRQIALHAAELAGG